MRKFFNILIISAVAILASCYDDKGNYDYNEINEISVDTEMTGTYFAVDRFDTLRIEPVLQFSQGEISEDQLEYKWEMYIDDWAGSDTQATVLSREKNLNVQITRAESVNLYALVFTVTETKSGCSYRQKYTVSIQPSVMSGLMLMQDDGGRARLDYFASTLSEPTFAAPHHFADVLSSANNGFQMNGTPIGVTYSVVTKSSYEPQVKRLYVWTDKEVALMEANDFSVLHSNDEMFMVKPAILNPECIIRSGNYSTYMINDGDVHVLNQQATMSFGYQFSRALKSNSTLSYADVKFAPYVYQPDEFESYTGFSAILYDTIGKRFVKVDGATAAEPEIKAFDQQNEAALKLFDVNNIGKDMVWMGKGNAGQGFAVFADGEGKREIYRCRFNIRSTVTDEEGNQEVNPQVYNQAMGVYDLSAVAEGSDAKFFETSRYANYVLYASERNIYTYDFSSRRATLINDPFPEDEVITAMKIYNVESYTANLTDVSGNLLYVATWNGKEGKVYEFAINRTTGRLNNRRDDAEGNLKKPYGVYGGFAKVVSMCVKSQGRSD